MSLLHRKAMGLLQGFLRKSTVLWQHCIISVNSATCMHASPMGMCMCHHIYMWLHMSRHSMCMPCWSGDGWHFICIKLMCIIGNAIDMVYEHVIAFCLHVTGLHLTQHLYPCFTSTPCPPQTCPCVLKPGPRLNIKTIFPRYGESKIKDKTVMRLSYF